MFVMAGLSARPGSRICDVDDAIYANNWINFGQDTVLYLVEG